MKENKYDDEQFFKKYSAMDFKGLVNGRHWKNFCLILNINACLT